MAEPEIEILREVTSDDGIKSACYKVNGEYREDSILGTAPEFWKRVFSLPTYEDDRYLVTYPRVGTTLTQTILLSLLSKDYAYDKFLESSPFIEFILDDYDGPKLAEEAERPRLLKTHLITTLMPKEYFVIRPKTIIVVRNFYDCLVSNYSFYKDVPIYRSLHPDIDFDKFFKYMVEDELHSYGSIFRWHKLWLEYATSEGKDHCLIIKYEDIVNNKSETTKEMAKFFNISVSESSLKEVEEASDFKSMQKRFDGFFLKNFIRQGTTNKGQRKFSEEQRKALMAKFVSEVGSVGHFIDMPEYSV